MQTSDDEPIMLAALAAASPLLPLSDEQRAAMTKEGILRDSALWYASLGWPVFPLVPGQKIPAVPGGFKSATTDAGTITEWWASRPHANIGTPTGLSFDVIDIDAPDGFATWAVAYQEWRADGFELPPLVAIAETGSGGRHLLIATQGRRNGAGLGVGLDYRGVGGYIVLPPSQLATGGIYQWIKRP